MDDGGKKGGALATPVRRSRSRKGARVAPGANVVPGERVKMGARVA